MSPLVIHILYLILLNISGICVKDLILYCCWWQLCVLLRQKKRQMLEHGEWSNSVDPAASGGGEGGGMDKWCFRLGLCTLKLHLFISLRRCRLTGCEYLQYFHYFTVLLQLYIFLPVFTWGLKFERIQGGRGRRNGWRESGGNWSICYIFLKNKC